MYSENHVLTFMKLLSVHLVVSIVLAWCLINYSGRYELAGWATAAILPFSIFMAIVHMSNFAKRLSVAAANVVMHESTHPILKHYRKSV